MGGKVRWFRRVDPVRRLELAGRAGLLDPTVVAGLLPLATQLRGRLRFAHGDMTTRNVLAGDGDGNSTGSPSVGQHPGHAGNDRTSGGASAGATAATPTRRTAPADRSTP